MINQTKNNKNKFKPHEKGIRIILEICAAIVLWLYINGSSIDLVTQDLNGIPITFTNMNVLESRGLTLNEDKNYYVNLRLRGTETNLQKLDVNEITASIDLKDIEDAGDYTPEINIMGLSNSVILEEMKPAKLSIHVEKFDNHDFEVIVNTNGKPADDNVVISATTNEHVRIDGTDDDLSRIDSVVAVADVHGLTDDSGQYAKVKAYDKDGDEIQDLDIEPRAVYVDIVIGKTKKVQLKTPKTTGDAAPGHLVTNVSIEPVTKLVGGKPEDLEALTELEVENVDVSGAADNIRKDVEINLPENVYFMDDNNKVTVSVKIEEEIEKSYTINGIEARNLGPGLSVEKIQDASVVVKLQGSASELAKIKGSDMTAWIDLSGKSAGKYDIPVQIKVPGGTIKNISPDKTSVTILQ